MKRFLSVFFILTFILGSKLSFSQIELTATGDPVYDFLKRQQIQGVIPSFNSANLPLSNGEVIGFLMKVDSLSDKISLHDKKILQHYLMRYANESGINSRMFVKNNSQPRSISNLYSYSDSNASLFIDAAGGLIFKRFSGTGYSPSSILFGGAGLKIHGSLINSFGYYLKATNYVKFSGNSDAIKFARLSDPIIYSDWKFDEAKINYFSPFTGYLRYQTPTNLASISLGRLSLLEGRGYIDKLFLSANVAPFDIAKIDFKYKSISYSFMYGSLRGDSAGINSFKLNSKNIAAHRLDISFSEKFKFGFFESVIIPNSPFSLTFLNPISLLTTAEINKASQGQDDNANNSLLGIDFEYSPIDNLAVQYSLLVDDINWSSFLKKDDISNKFAYQLGLIFDNFCSVPSLVFAAEYTRLNPFIYTHTTNKSQYTHWDLPLGHSLKPNSEEFAFKVSYDFNAKLGLNFIYKYRRHAEGFVLNSNGKMILNYGGDIDNGTNFFSDEIGFLKGNRFNTSVLEFNLRWEPVYNSYIELNMNYLDEKNLQTNLYNNLLNTTFTVSIAKF